MPMSVEEYKIGQLYSVTKASLENTKGDTAVEILLNEEFENERGKGQYTHKVYHMGSKVPRFVAAIMPATALMMVEKSWNAYPYCRTEFSNPWLGDRFSVILESLHLPDNGSTENAHNLSGEMLEKREIEYINIATYQTTDEAANRFDPTTFRSVKTDRGNLQPDWAQEHQPVMCCYKLVTIKFQYFGLQTKVEDSIQKSQIDILAKFHREIFCRLDEWFGLGVEDVRILEDQARKELEEALERMNLPSKGSVPKEDSKSANF